MRLSLHLVYPTASHGLGDPGRHPAQCRRHQVGPAGRRRPGHHGQRLSPSELVPRQRPDGRTRPPFWQTTEAPAQGLGLAQPGFVPARARRVPHLCVCWYSGSMLPAPPGPAPASTKHVLTAPLPASGFRSQDPPPLPSRAVPTRATLVAPARREKGNE